VHKYNLDAAVQACLHIQAHFDQALRKAGMQPGAGGPRAGWWFATGCLARVPVGNIGNFKADFGLLGSALVRVSE
jgi:hypothetical protein